MLLSSRLVALIIVTVAAVATPRASSAQRATEPVQVASAVLARPGDVVRLRIWREPDMSGEFPVDANGEAVFPRLGTMQVTDISVDSLKRRLVNAYTTYLRDPSIEVTMLRRVSVAGAVRTPGVFTVDPTLTVADVVALAGGATPEGHKDRVEVVRSGESTSQRISRVMRVGDTLLRSGDQIVVPERSWASRNLAVIMGGVSTIGFLAATIINNR